ncbi:hypothetical protein FYK55_24265 [Roseiconus nitratireducens]|uniref:Peptidase M56 domain-containing protein n=1 Tax=Roseiconus nitratireducens TaxID=2605748 RepID=A0A5M6CW47_9BACT|nr:carboxypeptidase regulatory-like domain-containing protein [Roseiconus nitratireducens]KAA5539451.1 hypothetical protein FYK55_24265 [Roseiconus nitratireducens]
MSSFSMFLSELAVWLLEAALVSTLLLAVGYLIATRCRNPADRLRILQWTLAMTLAAFVFTASSSRLKIEIPVAQASTQSQRTLVQSRSTPSSAPRALTTEQGFVDGTALNPQRDIPPADSAIAGPVEVESNHSIAEGPLSGPRATAPSAAATEGSIRWWFVVGISLLALYLSGVAFSGLRWFAAQIRLNHLLRCSQPVPSAVSDEFRGIAGEAATDVRLRISAHVCTPITWGLWSPVILLPASVVGAPDRATLRYFLAHEWSHVRRRDSWTWQMAIATQCLLFYHPLYWIVRRELLISMDRIADAEAAGQGDSSIDYAAFLVQLARQRSGAIPQLTLGVSDKRSQLQQRVKHLLGGEGLAGTVCSRRRKLAIASLAILIGLAGAMIRFETRAVAADPPQEIETQESTSQDDPSQEDSPQPSVEDSESEIATEQPNSPPAMSPLELFQQISDAAEPAVGELLKASCQERPDGSILYVGFVRNAANDLPIPGATVKVHRKLSRDPKTGGWSTIEVTEHRSNAIGLYHFTLPPEQVAQSSLYIEVEAAHPNYASKSRSGYSHTMIRKNLKMGELPFYTEIRLWPGEPIEGTIVSPDGKPLEDVKVSMYASSDQASGFPAGSFDRTVTDAKGRFRIVPPTPGDGVLWIQPEQFSPQAHRIRDRRGDWGEFKLESGSTTRGRVLDVDGDPVSGVRISARRQGDGDEADEYLNSSRVANQIGREVVTSETGEYELTSLPVGDYRIRIEPNAKEGDYDPPPLEDVFVQQSLKIENQEPQEFDIQALPHVVLDGTYLDSNNQPRTGSEVMLFGRLDGEFYFTQSSSPGKDGKFQIRIPHGLKQTKMDLITNEHSALKWRMSREQPLQRGRNVDLGLVEDDITGFEVVRYTAPILMVKAVDESGKMIPDVVPIVTYTRDGDDREGMVMYPTGSRVSFEKQNDGRHRSSQMLPDEPIEVTVKKDGYSTEPQRFTLGEGEIQDAEFVIKPVADQPSKTQSDDED